MSEILIGPMTAADVAQIAALERECFSQPWSAASVASELENPLSCWLVARLDGQVAGYVGAQKVPPEADMMNLAVAPAFRRQGLAQRLLRALTDRLAAQGITSLSLEVRESNLPARRLYALQDFRLVGRRSRYYVAPVETALILRKELSDADSVD